MKNKIIGWLTAIWAALLLSGCGGDSAGNDTESITGQTIQSTKTLVHGNRTREYILYIPAAYDGSTEVPLVLNFHGFSISAERHLNSNADMRALAEAHNFILVYPQGTLTQIGNLPNWNAARPATNGGVDDLGFIETLISKLALQYNIDDRRVYAIGYSNGAMMSFALACYSDNLIAAVGSVSGTQLDTSTNCAPSHPTAIINIHGTSDIILPYNGNIAYKSVNNVMAFWRNQNDTNSEAVFTTVNDRGTPIEHYQYNQGANEVAVEHYKVIGGGHSWFNFNYQGSSTNEVIWDFISKYDLGGLR